MINFLKVLILSECFCNILKGVISSNIQLKNTFFLHLTTFNYSLTFHVNAPRLYWIVGSFSLSLTVWWFSELCCSDWHSLFISTMPSESHCLLLHSQHSFSSSSLKCTENYWYCILGKRVNDQFVDAAEQF